MDDSSIAKIDCFAFIDGASRGNPGESAFAVILGNEKGEIFYQCAGRIGIATNNEAEYRALLEALRLLLERRIRRVTIFSDSQLLVNHLRGRYKVHSPHLYPLFKEAQERIAQFEHFSMVHIPREENTLADRLASATLTQNLRYNIPRR